MWEIYEIFGIEATREFLIEEFTKVISADGTFINTTVAVSGSVLPSGELFRLYHITLNNIVLY